MLKEVKDKNIQKFGYYIVRIYIKKGSNRKITKKFGVSNFMNLDHHQILFRMNPHPLFHMIYLIIEIKR